VINLATAKARGSSIPQTVLASARVKNEESLFGYQTLSEDGAPDRIRLGAGWKYCPFPSFRPPNDRSNPQIIAAGRRDVNKPLGKGILFRRFQPRTA